MGLPAGISGPKRQALKIMILQGRKGILPMRSGNDYQRSEFLPFVNCSSRPGCG